MSPASTKTTLTLSLSGDVMTGRGIDQILRAPSAPGLHESYVTDARTYVDLAEDANGPIPRGVDGAYVWGDALAELERRSPDLRVVNLETSITGSEDAWPGKGIHYRMSPTNIDALTAARIDCCALANNHVLDWGYAGLSETLATLERAGIASAGAGPNLDAAAAPAALEAPAARVLVFAFGFRSSGIPSGWAAGPGRAGVNLLLESGVGGAREIARVVDAARAPRDIVVVSLHWGGNWGYEIPTEQRRLAHALIDAGAADVVHGHSSHHVKGIEVHEGKLVLYGAGDLINDYEGISGHGSYRGDLSLLYFVRVDGASGRLLGAELVPFQMRRFSLRRASPADTEWLESILDREGRLLGTRVERQADGTLKLSW